MRYTEFSGSFATLVENTISKYQTGGVNVGEFCTIRKDALKNPEISNKPSGFINKVKEMMATGLNLKIASINSSKPDRQNDMGTAPTDKFYVDVVIETAPGLFMNPITLPLECIDVVEPEGNNWSPKVPDELKGKNRTQIKPKEEKTKDKELNDRTKGNERQMPKKNTKLGIGDKEPKDGRSQTKVKEEFSISLFERDTNDMTLLAESILSGNK